MVSANGAILCGKNAGGILLSGFPPFARTPGVEEEEEEEEVYRVLLTDNNVP